MLRGRYPADVHRATPRTSALASHVVRDGDLALIGAPIDVLGVNYYHGDAVSAARSRLAPHRRPTTTALEAPRGTSPFPAAEHVTVVPRDLPRTAMDWEVQPDGLRRLLVRIHDDY